MVAVLPPVPPVPVMKHQKSLRTLWVRRYQRPVAKWSPLLKARKKGWEGGAVRGMENGDDMEMVQ